LVDRRWARVSHHPGREKAILDRRPQNLRFASGAEAESAILAGVEQPILQEFSKRRRRAIAADEIYVQNGGELKERREAGYCKSWRGCCWYDWRIWKAGQSLYRRDG